MKPVAANATEAAHKLVGLERHNDV